MKHPLRRIPILLSLAVLLSAVPGCQLGTDPPQSYVVQYDKAFSLLRNENYAGARSAFSALIQDHPSGPLNAEAELLLADCESRLGNKAEARRIRERTAANSNDPQLKARALYGLGRLELESEEFEAAAGRFEQSARLESEAPKRAQYLSYQGLALQQAGKFAAARRVYGEAIAIDAGSSNAKFCERQLAYPDHFAVQTGAFIDPAKAARQVEALAAKGITAEVIPADTARGKLHCVRVGRFPDRAAANAMRDRVIVSKALPETSRVTVKP